MGAFVVGASGKIHAVSQKRGYPGSQKGDSPELRNFIRDGGFGDCML
jgi:hypothetical protein